MSTGETAFVIFLFMIPVWIVGRYLYNRYIGPFE